jgi:hypothetical protein
MSAALAFLWPSYSGIILSEMAVMAVLLAAVAMMELLSACG